MTIKYKVTEQKRQELAKEMSRWLGMPIGTQGEDLIIDIFTLKKNGTLVFYEKTDSEMVERLLEHLYDCGYETAEFDEADEEVVQLIVEAQSLLEGLTARIKVLENKLKKGRCE